MVNCTSCGGAGVETKLVSTYDATGLGAPFKVILEGAVKVSVCTSCTAKLATYIPDMEGLFHAVVFARSLEPRKISGAEIKFMRKAMNWKAKEIAKHLGITAEYLSRCEAGDKVFSETTEKLFRVYALLRTPDKSALAEIDLTALFDLIKIDTLWDASKPLVFHFVRRPITQHETGDGKWRKEEMQDLAA